MTKDSNQDNQQKESFSATRVRDGSLSGQDDHKNTKSEVLPTQVQVERKIYDLIKEGKDESQIIAMVSKEFSSIPPADLMKISKAALDKMIKTNELEPAHQNVAVKALEILTVRENQAVSNINSSLTPVASPVQEPTSAPVTHTQKIQNQVLVSEEAKVSRDSLGRS